MDFLKAILGDELFNQIKKKIDEYNGDEANKDKKIKIANLGSGEYVDVNKYNDLKSTLTSKSGELDKANGLIEELKKSNEGNADLQSKVTAYDTQVKELQAQLAEEKKENAIKIALMESKANDVDYMAFKLKEKGEVELDENGHIKGWENTLKALKTQFPKQFEEDQKKIEENKLASGNGNDGAGEPKTLAEAIKMTYEKKEG